MECSTISGIKVICRSTIPVCVRVHSKPYVKKKKSLSPKGKVRGGKSKGGGPSSSVCLSACTRAYYYIVRRIFCACALKAYTDMKLSSGAPLLPLWPVVLPVPYRMVFLLSAYLSHCRWYRLLENSTLTNVFPSLILFVGKG